MQCFFMFLLDVNDGDNKYLLEICVYMVFGEI